MKKEQVLELMNTVGPDLIEEADLRAPARRRFPKAVRTGLIAACLCLAFVGTAFAAANPEAVADLLSRFAPVQVEPATLPDGSEILYFSYGITRYPMDSFSPALLAAGEGRESDLVELHFDSWAETRAFIGESIPCVLPETGEDREEGFTVYLSYSKGELVMLDVSTNTSSRFLVSLNIHTEHFFGGDQSSGGLTGDSDSHAEVLAPYSMHNGCEAQITLLTRPADPDNPNDFESAFCFGTFTRDGILYRVASGGPRWPEDELLAPLYDTLDLFP